MKQKKEPIPLVKKIGDPVMNPDLIRKTFQNKNSPISKEAENSVLEVIDNLDKGLVRVCEKKVLNGKSILWVKEAILLYFKITKTKEFHAGDFNFSIKYL